MYTYTHTSIYLNKLTAVRREVLVYICILFILEVINKEIMQNEYYHHQQQQTSNPSNTEIINSNDENISFTNIPSNNNIENVEEKEHANDEKHIEIGVDIENNNSNNNDKPLIEVVMSDESSLYENFCYCQPQTSQHKNSHDSLLQPDYNLMDNINTTASSTDDLSTTHQLSSSVFHSKDSALGLSDDNLNILQTTNQDLIHDDDDDVQHPLLIITQDNQSKYLIISLFYIK